MSVSTQQRQVQRQVKVYKCDRCRAEGTEDSVSGWMMLLVLELLPMPNPLTMQISNQLTAKPGADQHLCPACTQLVQALVRAMPAPSMVGNDEANIPLRLEGGGTAMLTRFEYDAWVQKGKPPVLSEADVKVKS